MGASSKKRVCREIIVSLILLDFWARLWSNIMGKRLIPI